MSGSKSKKNGKKNKASTIPEVLQVKSVKLETNKTNEDRKNNTKSEGNLRKSLKNSPNSSFRDEETNLETLSLVNAFMNLSLNSEGENTKVCTGSIDEATVNRDTSDSLPLVMQYCPENGDDIASKVDGECSYNYQSYAKNSKCIKFTNQVTVLYFNGEDVLCESMEPLKKEQEQQLRNKEMRKEHLLTKGPLNNIYLI